jgi:uncharacterized membrane protein
LSEGQDQAEQPSRQASENIDTVMALEAEASPPLPWRKRVAERIGDIAGSAGFILFHLGWFVLWALANQAWVPGQPVVDEYPYPLLALLLAMEAVILASCVLIRQNRAAELAEERSHIDLQINLLAERETTKVIQMLDRLSVALGIEHLVVDQESRELSEHTTVPSLARKLRERRGGDSVTEQRSAPP